MRLYFDGWYMMKRDAKACLHQCEDMGAVAVGLVESKHGIWGLLYWCDRELFYNHAIDAHNAAASPLHEMMGKLDIRVNPSLSPIDGERLQNAKEA